MGRGVGLGCEIGLFFFFILSHQIDGEKKGGGVALFSYAIFDVSSTNAHDMFANRRGWRMICRAAIFRSPSFVL